VSLLARSLWGLSAVAVAGCGGGDSAIQSRFAPDFATTRHTVSVFGVYRDGQMSSESWLTLGPRISAALGASRCEAAYSEPLVTSRAAMWSAVEDYARSNGPTDDLLAQLAPAANGDLILVITSAGHIPEKHASGANAEAMPTMNAPGMGGRGGGGGMGGGMAGASGARGSHESSRSGPGGDALDLSASLYSVAAGHSVGLVSLEYQGQSADEAIAQLAAKLAQSLHGATCVGWNWGAKIDEDRLRQIREP
jgi:hypothetical protein